MVDGHDFTQLEAVFAQEHPEVLKVAVDAGMAYRLVVLEIDGNSSTYLSHCLAGATTHDARERWQMLLAQARDRENYPDHPDNFRFSQMRQEAVRKAIAAFRPVIAARREFLTKKRVDLTCAEQEFFGRFGVARVDTPIHSLLNHFERDTNSHEMLIVRHGLPGFSTWLPGPIAALLAHSSASLPVAPEVRPAVATAVSKPPPPLISEPIEELPYGTGGEEVTNPSEWEH